MKVHPDRGGSKKEFQKVSIAYTVLKKKLKEQSEIHHHNELKSNAKSLLAKLKYYCISNGLVRMLIDKFEIIQMLLGQLKRLTGS